ncbi:MAG: hypothetical protein KBD56_08755 [Candidatus Eisenbacteria bacterium]|nr:hypothetical protein [Candidatus Eisenbacteria bacterium]
MRIAASYFGNRIPRHVAADMQLLHTLGFTRVVHTFSETDMTFYRATMREIVRISGDCGLETLLDPWGVGRVFGGEAYSQWLLEEPDLFQRGPSGRLLGGCCLNHPGLRARMHAWIDAAAETGAPWIFWDEPHWVFPGPLNPHGEICACEHCERRLRELHPGADLRSASRETITELRERGIRDLLVDLTCYAHAQGLRSSVCVLPHGFLEQPALDHDALLADGRIHEFGTDPYWDAFGMHTPEERRRFVETHAGEALRICRRAQIPSMLWVQAFRIPAAREAELFAGTRELLQYAPDTIAIWGFEACAHMSAIACERPAAVWNGLIDALHDAQRDLGPGAP